MSRTIWKYPIECVDEQRIRVPFGALPLFAGLDPAGRMCIWVSVEPLNTDGEEITICIVGTGHPTPGDAIYLNSFIDGPFVWHVFRPTLKRKQATEKERAT